MARGERFVKERLEQLRARIERLSGPAREVPGVVLHRLARPMFSALGWTPTLSMSKARELVEVLRAESDRSACAAALSLAVGELAANVRNVEQAAAVWDRTPMAHAAWLSRVHRMFAIVQQGLDRSDLDLAEARSVAAEFASAATLPPLQGKVGIVRPAAVESTNPELGSPGVGKLVGTMLASVDHLLELGRREVEFLGRRRAWFEAARTALLDASAALPLESEGVTERLRIIALELARIDRYVLAGIDPEVEILHQARQAHARRDEVMLRAAVSALADGAQRRGDVQGARIVARAVSTLWADRSEDAFRLRLRADRAHATSALGDDVVASVARGYAKRRAAMDARELSPDELTRERDYVAVEAVDQTLSCTSAVDGYFELGGHVSPVRVTEHERFVRVVRWPTPVLDLVPATSVEDIPDAVIDDPRLLLLQLATGRLLSRRFVEERLRTRSRPALASEVRIFLLDGSTSMHGHRERVRDALLVAELATLRKRLGTPRHVKPVLFYAYFDDVVGKAVRVDSAPAALEAVEDVVGRRRAGGTDIQGALLAAFALVRQAREAHEDLGRAQIVLVTDGDADVDETLVVTQRKMASGDVPLGVSVIALGTENAALRGLVARQRARGERAFYHYVDDATLATMSTSPDARPLVAMLRGDADTAKPDLPATIGEVIDDLELLRRAPDVASIEHADAERLALEELGALGTHDEGVAARLEARARDKRALGRRFELWFPAPRDEDVARGQDLASLDPDSDEGRDVDAVTFALASIAEILRSFGGSDLTRMADAIELFERLLVDAGLSPSRYHVLLEAQPVRLAPALATLRAAVRLAG